MEFKRNCPICNKEIKYKDNRSCENARKKKTLCRSCMQKGEKNHMYNKSVYDVWKEKYGEEIANVMLLEKSNKNKETWNNKSDIELKEHSEKISNKVIGKNNSMYGKTIYEVWVEKYGEEIADQKHNEWKINVGKSISGEKNGMFGKPSPIGSGNGWSGYYKEHYFRSILELHYLIYLIDNNINFESGEKKKHAIKYIMDDVERNYFPDYYLIDTNEYIEIKPKGLINSYQNKLKFKAALEKLGNKHVIITEENIVKIDINILYNFYLNKEILFDKGYIEKFENYYNKNRKG